MAVQFSDILFALIHVEKFRNTSILTVVKTGLQRYHDTRFS